MAWPAEPSRPTTDDIRMIRPRRARSIPWVARLTTRKAAVRLASMTPVKSASLIRSRSMSLLTPAFETSTSTGPPKCSSIAAKALSTSADDVTSHLTPNSPSGGSEER